MQIELMASKLKIGCVLLVGGNALGACGGEVGLRPAATGGYTADGDGTGGAYPGSGGLPGFVGNIGSGGASYGTGGVPGFLGVPVGTAPTGGAPGSGGTDNEGGLGGGDS